MGCKSSTMVKPMTGEAAGDGKTLLSGTPHVVRKGRSSSLQSSSSHRELLASPGHRRTSTSSLTGRSKRLSLGGVGRVPTWSGHGQRTIFHLERSGSGGILQRAATRESGNQFFRPHSMASFGSMASVRMPIDGGILDEAAAATTSSRSLLAAQSGSSSRSGGGGGSGSGSSKLHPHSSIASMRKKASFKPGLQGIASAGSLEDMEEMDAFSSARKLQEWTSWHGRYKDFAPTQTSQRSLLPSASSHITIAASVRHQIDRALQRGRPMQVSSPHTPASPTSPAPLLAVQSVASATPASPTRPRGHVAGSVEHHGHIPDDHHLGDEHDHDTMMDVPANHTQHRVGSPHKPGLGGLGGPGGAGAGAGAGAGMPDLTLPPGVTHAHAGPFGSTTSAGAMSASRSSHASLSGRSLMSGSSSRSFLTVGSGMDSRASLSNRSMHNPRDLLLPESSATLTPATAGSGVMAPLSPSAMSDHGMQDAGANAATLSTRNMPRWGSGGAHQSAGSLAATDSGNQLAYGAPRSPTPFASAKSWSANQGRPNSGRRLTQDIIEGVKVDDTHPVKQLLGQQISALTDSENSINQSGTMASNDSIPHSQAGS